MRIPGILYVQGKNAYADPDGAKYGIAIHNTSNDASARNEASYATRRTDGISSHLYADNVEVIQSLDTKDKAGHAGSSQGNDHAIAVEITGVNAWSRAQWLDRVAWDKLGQALAHVCRAYGIPPRRLTVAQMRESPKTKGFYGHDDMRLAWGGTTHTDPGPNFPWDKLFAAVNAAMTGGGTVAAMDDRDTAIAYRRIEAVTVGANKVLDGPTKGEQVWLVTAHSTLQGKVVELKSTMDAGVAQILARPQVEAAPVDPAALKAVLLDPVVLAAIADAVLDAQAQRLAE